MKIAVIGSGIAGLASAWLLAKEHQVTLFEKEDYLGGHSNTRKADFAGTEVWADTGFMVFNNHTYPNLVGLFETLGVEIMKTDMSFGVSLGGGRFEYASDEFFVQKRNFFKPSFWRMLRDIVYFNQHAAEAVGSFADNVTLRELLQKLNLSEQFAEQYLLLLSGAIWSSSKENMLEHPAKQFVIFCENHGLLNPKTLNPFKIQDGWIQWYTLQGGSRQYVEKMVASMSVDICLSSPVTALQRQDGKVLVTAGENAPEEFDAIVCASHPRQTLATLTDATTEERALLEVFHYVKNRTVMHSDTSHMLKHTSKWPSWTYQETAEGKVELSYHMNRLQRIDSQYPLFVTLNPAQEIPAEQVFYEVEYEHPQFNLETEQAQRDIKDVQGANGLYFAGAWLGHGFHEDGIRSAVEIATRLGVTIPWSRPSGTS